MHWAEMTLRQHLFTGAVMGFRAYRGKYMGAFGYARRVIITPAVYPGLFELDQFDTQSAGSTCPTLRNV